MKFVEKYELASLIICAIILFAKYILALFVQGGAKFENGSRPPEDSKFNKGSQSFESTGDEKEKRWTRIVQNDVESIPISLLIFILALFAGNSVLNVICYFGYTFSRLMHTYAFANGLQPHRSIFWFGGLLFAFISLFNSLVSVFTQ
ncbi:hypothetical protein HDV01_007052 [Terramyces sp. JEL0728]|nr:hypothetical protein HDV01_007052 [Terramyces sp. JEL0728]